MMIFLDFTLIKSGFQEFSKVIKQYNTGIFIKMARCKLSQYKLSENFLNDWKWKSLKFFKVLGGGYEPGGGQ